MHQAAPDRVGLRDVGVSVVLQRGDRGLVGHGLRGVGHYVNRAHGLPAFGAQDSGQRKSLVADHGNFRLQAGQPTIAGPWSRCGGVWSRPGDCQLGGQPASRCDLIDRFKANRLRPLVPALA